jgi:hypothetical protein
MVDDRACLYVFDAPREDDTSERRRRRWRQRQKLCARYPGPHPALLPYRLTNSNDLAAVSSIDERVQRSNFPIMDTCRALEEAAGNAQIEEPNRYLPHKGSDEWHCRPPAFHLEAEIASNIATMTAPRSVYMQAHTMLHAAGNNDRAPSNGAHQEVRPSSAFRRTTEYHAFSERDVTRCNDRYRLGSNTLDLHVLHDAKGTENRFRGDPRGDTTFCHGQTASLATHLPDKSPLRCLGVAIFNRLFVSNRSVSPSALRSV